MPTNNRITTAYKHQCDAPRKLLAPIVPRSRAEMVTRVPEKNYIAKGQQCLRRSTTVMWCSLPSML